MLELLPSPRTPGAVDPTLPVCSLHPGSAVRRYRATGPAGPGVYPQCVPARDGLPHLLEWPGLAIVPTSLEDPRDLTDCELDVLADAAAGLTTLETAHKRVKGVETVKTQRRSILLKLGARNMAHAIGMTNELRTA